MAIIPKKPKKSKQGKREWFNKEKIKNPVKKELAEKTKKLIEKKSKSQMKEVVYSYMCPGCKSSFSAGSLQMRIIESARRGDSYISCPKCGVHLVADRTTKVSTKQNSKVNRNANLTITYPNQGITPSYTPNSWIDRAILEKIAHELGKYCQKFGFFNPQLKFQRGIRGKVSADALKNVKAAEYTIEAVDDYDLRFRVVAAAGITPAGKVVLPKFFMTLDGREIPFTKEAVASFLSGKVFGPVDPTPVVPELYYKDRDLTRFREIVASRKKKATLELFKTDTDAIKKADELEKFFEGRRKFMPVPISWDPADEASGPRIMVGDVRIDEAPVEGETYWVVGEGWEDVNAWGLKSQVLASRKKKAAGIPTPGQTAEYQGKKYIIDSVTGDASVLTDEAGVQTAPISNAELNIQVEEGAVPPAPTLADRINKLVKRSLRDEKTLVPFTDPAPDYSVAKQTDVDADFSVPYKDSDQGILSEEERAVQKMFRGGSVIKPVKTAAVRDIDEISDDLLSDFDDYLEGFYSEGSHEKALEGWLKRRNYTLTEDEVQYLLRDIKQKVEDMGLEASVIKPVKTAQEEPEEALRRHFRSVERTEDEHEGAKQVLKEVAKEDYGVDLSDEVVDDLAWKAVKIDPEAMTDDMFNVLYRYIQQSYPEKIASIKKTAEPTGYHETDDTGKVIELSRLRTLVQDYARAGQLPLDFDLTKVMSEVSRMTRKELEDILDKKQKGQHYPVVHAKKKAFVGEMPIYHEGDEVMVEDERAPETPRKAKVNRVVDYNNATESYIYNVKYEDTGEDVDVYGFKLQSVPKEKISRNISQKISSKSTNQIVREIRKNALVGDLTEEDIKKDIKEEEEGAKHYNQMAKDVDSPKTEKVLKDMADDEAEHAEELEEVVLPAVKNTKNYLEKYDSRKKAITFEKQVVVINNTWGVIQARHFPVIRIEIPQGTLGRLLRINPTSSNIIFDASSVLAANPDLGQKAKDKYIQSKKDFWGESFEENFDEEESQIADDYFNWVDAGLADLQTQSEIKVTSVPNKDLEVQKQASRKKKAQEEEVEEEEKPKTTLKELKTKPHGRPAAEEVAEAPAAAPELQTVFNEVKQHQQRLTEIKAIIAEARRKTEEEIRKIQEEHGSVAEAAEMQEGIEKLSSLIEQSESQIADLGEFFVWLDTESKTKKFKPSDKWRVEKLLEKFGKDAEEYLDRAERGSSSLNEEIQQRLLTVFPKLPKDKESSISKKADVFDIIADLGKNLWSYVKSISGLLAEGEQLELALS